MLLPQTPLLHTGLETAMGSRQRNINTVNLAADELGNLHTTEPLYVLEVDDLPGLRTEGLQAIAQVVDLDVSVGPVDLEPGAVEKLDHVIGQRQGGVFSFPERLE